MIWAVYLKLGLKTVKPTSYQSHRIYISILSLEETESNYMAVNAGKLRDS